MSPFRWLGSLLSDMKLRNKLHISFVLFLILPLAVFTFLFYYRASGTLREQTVISADQAFGEAQIKLENKLQNMINVIDQFTLNANLNEILSHHSYDSIAAQLGDYTSLVTFLENLERSQEGMRVQVYMNGQFAATADNKHTFMLQPISDTPWFRKLTAAHSSLSWFASEQDGHSYLSAVRIIWNVKNLTQRLGVIKVDIPAELVGDILAQTLIDRDGQAFLVGSDGNVAVQAGTGELNESEMTTIAASRPPSETGLRPSEWNTDKRGYIVYGQPVAGTDWMLGCVIPMESVLRPIAALRNQMLLILLSIAVVGYLIALYAANLSTKRIGRLIRRMRNLQINDLGLLEEPCGKDEVGELIHNFNEMILHMRQLIQERFRSGQALKNTELRLLQAQINPHFLYNSLDVINIMAMERQAPDISKMVRALGTFYKLGLNNGEEIVAVGDEVEHIRAYVEIQNIRFDNRIGLQIDMPADCLAWRMPKFVLQPLVENAILHGILEKKGESGRITIEGDITGRQFTITVRDDGIGMDETIAGQLLAAAPHGQRSGFGLRNVHERIRLTFGSQFGLAVSSAPDEGTAVRIALPLMDEAGLAIAGAGAE